MLLGHIGIGLATKRIFPGISLFVLLPLSMALDILALPAILFPSKVIDLVPWTHGLFMAFIIALTTSLLTVLISHNFRYTMTMGLVILSHWVLDFISWPMFGRGLPVLFNGSPEVGLGLYSTGLGSISGEIGGLFFIVVMVIILRKRTFSN